MVRKSNTYRIQLTKGCIVLIVLFILTFQLAATSIAKETIIPHEVGGFELGTSVADYPDINYSNYLKEVVVTDWHGFRKGIISYGVCDKPGDIVKIRMKYEDDSRKFYKDLLKTYKEKFGDPQIWKGDSFGVLHVWKWKFTDSEGRIVNLILQHNSQNPEENMGTAVKLSFPEQEERERLCFIESCDLPENEEHKKRKEELRKPDWDLLIPR